MNFETDRQTVNQFERSNMRYYEQTSQMLTRLSDDKRAKFSTIDPKNEKLRASPPINDRDKLERLRQYKKAIASYKILKTCEFKLATKDLHEVIESDLNLMTPAPDDDEILRLTLPPFIPPAKKHRSSLVADDSIGLSTPGVELGKKALKDLMSTPSTQKQLSP